MSLIFYNSPEQAGRVRRWKFSRELKIVSRFAGAHGPRAQRSCQCSEDLNDRPMLQEAGLNVAQTG